MFSFRVRWLVGWLVDSKKQDCGEVNRRQGAKNGQDLFDVHGGCLVAPWRVCQAEIYIADPVPTATKGNGKRNINDLRRENAQHEVCQF